MVRKIFDLVATFFGLFTEITRKAVENGICDFSGQGRNKNGKR